MKFTIAAALFAGAALLLAQPAAPQHVGPVPGGGHLLPTGWICHPDGRQVPLDPFPVSSLLSRDGNHLLILHSGLKKPSIRVLSTKTFEVTGSAVLDGAWGRMAFSPDGRTLYVAGGATGNVVEFSFSTEGKLRRQRLLSTLPRGESLTERDFVSDVALTPDGRLIYAALLFRNEVVVINPQSGWVIERFPTGRRPYRILFHPNGKFFYVTSWAENSLERHQTDDGSVLSLVRLGPQPMDMVWQGKAPRIEDGGETPSWKARLFVTMANTNRVQVLGVDESGELERLASIRVAMWPWQPLGMTPAALALSKEQDRLYVVCSDANVVAVVDVSRKQCRVLGFVPVGWYPTGATALAGGRLFVLNGRGDGGARHGTASVIAPGDAPQLFQATKRSLKLSPYNDRQLVMTPIPAGNPVPPGPRVPPALKSPIRHVLYIVKQGATYDQVLGDLGEGEGDASLTVFGAGVTPNQHKLASEFVLFDNFYTNGDTEADGINWSIAAIAPPFVQILWPSAGAGRLKLHPFEGRDLAAIPPAGYLWSNATEAGLSVRNYGFFVENRAQPGANGEQVKQVWDPSLQKITDLSFRGPDPAFRDTDRAKAFLKSLAAMEVSGEMPRLMVMRLANDGASGTTPGKIALKSAMADSDYALGLIVEACSKSRFWPRMAVFILEDSTRGGADHVDTHRAPAFIVSPYTHRGTVDSMMYNTTSMLRTIELILGLSPLTQFDAAATPMWAAFSEEPGTVTYTAVKPETPLIKRNP